MIWLDAHLSPRLARWLREEMSQETVALRDLGLRDAEDELIFERARKEKVVILTKDSDFVELARRFGAPPHIIWLRCGNTSETALKELLSKHLKQAMDYINAGEALVEIQ